MRRNFSGIADMAGIPAAMFVVDSNHEKIAVAEGNRCNIATIGLVDTNSDPTVLRHPIPGNDDAVKSIRIILDAITAAIQSGLGQRDSRRSARAMADMKAATLAAAEAAGIEGDVDLSRVPLPEGVNEEGEPETEIAATVKKRPSRARKTPVKAE